MANYEECYIAFLDIIGFKDLINHLDCDDILKIYDKIDCETFLLTDLKDVVMNGKLLAISVIPAPSFPSPLLSASVCMYIDANIKNALIGLIAACSYFQVKMLSLDNPIMVRGAIVKGNIYAKNDIVFGSGLTKAYLLEEKIAKVPRVIIPTSIVDEYNNYDPEYKALLSTYVYLDADYFYCAQYLLFYYCKAYTDGHLEKLLKHINKMLNMYYEPSIRDKYIFLQNEITKISNLYKPKIKSEK